MDSIKNIAIIAHVDHGKTTLVDKIMHHCQLFRQNENKGDLILDNNDLERERGITITSKNVSVVYNYTKINIIAEAKSHYSTGIEIEVIHAVAVTATTLYDMLKSYKKTIIIKNIQLVKKTGGSKKL